RHEDTRVHHDPKLLMRHLRGPRRLRRTDDGERGVAMITAVLIGMVVLTISITATDLSIHNSNASALDRNRILAIHAAEAGIDATLSLMQSTTSALLPCASPVVANLATPISERYSATVQYFTAYPPSGSPMSCPLGANATPRSALVVSTGTVLPTGANPHVARTMASEVKLTPVFGGFKQAIFSDQSPNITNNVTVNGNVGNDANLYTNQDWVCNNAGVDHGGIIA